LTVSLQFDEIAAGVGNHRLSLLSPGAGKVDVRLFDELAEPGNELHPVPNAVLRRSDGNEAWARALPRNVLKRQLRAKQRDIGPVSFAPTYDSAQARVAAIASSRSRTGNERWKIGAASPLPVMP
jgi:hypothetical protein